MKQEHPLKRKFWNPPKPLFNPWRRALRACLPRYGGARFARVNHFGRFEEYLTQNRYLDLSTKRAALDASPSVVTLISYIRAQQLFMCSGTILNSYGVEDQFVTTILTSATLIRCPEDEYDIADDVTVKVYLQDRSMCEGEILGFDMHYNIAAIRIKSGVKLQAAVIADLDNYTKRVVCIDQRFQLVPHHDTASAEVTKLCLEMGVIALGRYHDDPYHIMAAPGWLILKDINLDCQELRLANSEITKNGIGGPIINYSGCVIGLNFYTTALTPFLPINIALKCLDHLLKYWEVPRPWLGLEISDLDTITMGEFEKLVHNFSDNLSGVFVKKVELGSPASDAGICMGDIIVQIDDKHVESSLKFTSVLLDKAKEPFIVYVKRASSNEPLTLTMLPQSCRNLNRWPIPEEFELSHPALFN